ncbi:hypothetical protein HHI36_020249 [Cryptolaemus montrouzieri]|uniref:Uncharacterized protein n=1 Tax=Cryptolaemus montrouzieri TaxID=559131 RepID=A0ABD2NAC5_9CUCU
MGCGGACGGQFGCRPGCAPLCSPGCGPYGPVCGGCVSNGPGCGPYFQNCGFGPRSTCIPVAKCGADCGPGCGLRAPWCPAGPYCGQGRCALNCGSGCGPGYGPACGPLCGPMYGYRPRVYISGPRLYRCFPLPPAIGKPCWKRVGPKRYCNTCCIKKIISHIDLREAHRTIPFDPSGPYFCCK